MSTFTLQDLNLPATVDEAIKTMAEMSKVNAFETPIFSITPPQMGEVLPNPSLEQILKTISEQFALLSTVITQAKAQPNTTPPEGTLQETVDLVLQNNDWLYAKLADVMDEHYCIEDLVHEGIQDRVASEVEHYFNYSFTASDHFDIDDVVADRVDDKLEDIVAEKLEEYLSNAKITIERS